MNKKIGAFVGASSFSKEIEALIPTLSKNNASVLLIGERGTGKRFIAQHIHFSVAQNLGYFYEINCKSFSVEQIKMALDSVDKLISFERNSLGSVSKESDNTQKRITLFVCFVDEMSLELQKSFLDLINRSMRNGMNLKVICSVENPLEDKVASNQFLSELYYRLNAVVLNVLPLRQRKEDILPIAKSYLNSFSMKSGYKFTDFSENAIKAMENHFWIGNIDELINSVQRAFIVGEEPVIKTIDLGLENVSGVSSIASGTSGTAVDSKALQETADAVIKNDSGDRSLKTAVDLFKKEYLIKILEENGWNQTKTAKILGIQRTYVIRLMNELQIRK